MLHSTFDSSFQPNPIQCSVPFALLVLSCPVLSCPDLPLHVHLHLQPTTGLDSAGAFAVMCAVRNLAKSISVICTIHQPAAEIVGMVGRLYDTIVYYSTLIYSNECYGNSC